MLAATKPVQGFQQCRGCKGWRVVFGVHSLGSLLVSAWSKRALTVFGDYRENPPPTPQMVCMPRPRTAHSSQLCTASLEKNAITPQRTIGLPGGLGTKALVPEVEPVCMLMRGAALLGPTPSYRQ